MKNRRNLYENLEAERDHCIGIAAGLRGCVSELVEDTENGCAGSDRDALGRAGEMDLKLNILFPVLF